MTFGESGLAIPCSGRGRLFCLFDGACPPNHCPQRQDRLDESVAAEIELSQEPLR
jgi:hypothetical protein